MKTLLILALTFSLSGTDRSVYICESKGAVAYHLVRDCHGLQKCKSNIANVTETTAKSKGLHLCGFED